MAQIPGPQIQPGVYAGKQRVEAFAMRLAGITIDVIAKQEGGDPTVPEVWTNGTPGDIQHVNLGDDDIQTLFIAVEIDLRFW